MFKIEYKIEIPFTYDASHRGAPYSLDGGKTHKNGGEFAESCIKHHRGLDYMVNPSTTFDTGSDIEELNASVKSSGASLASLYGTSKEEILNEYFARVHSTLWIYGVNLDNETMVEYHMNADEFRAFLNEWAGLAVESGKVRRYKVRLKKTSGKMIKWLEERVG